LRFAVVALAFIAITSPVAAQSLSGQADVADVDTIAIRGGKARIRLYGVDGPERMMLLELGISAAQKQPMRSRPSSAVTCE
jgi:hypothetical protein